MIIHYTSFSFSFLHISEIFYIIALPGPVRGRIFSAINKKNLYYLPNTILISIYWYDKMETVKFGACLRCAEGEGRHPLVFLLPIPPCLRAGGFLIAAVFFCASFHQITENACKERKNPLRRHQSTIEKKPVSC